MLATRLADGTCAGEMEPLRASLASRPLAQRISLSIRRLCAEARLATYAAILVTKGSYRGISYTPASETGISLVDGAYATASTGTPIVSSACRSPNA